MQRDCKNSPRLSATQWRAARGHRKAKMSPVLLVTCDWEHVTVAVIRWLPVQWWRGLQQLVTSWATTALLGFLLCSANDIHGRQIVSAFGHQAVLDILSSFLQFLFSLFLSLSLSFSLVVFRFISANLVADSREFQPLMLNSAQRLSDSLRNPVNFFFE